MRASSLVPSCELTMGVPVGVGTTIVSVKRVDTSTFRSSSFWVRASWAATNRFCGPTSITENTMDYAISQGPKAYTIACVGEARRPLDQYGFTSLLP